MFIAHRVETQTTLTFDKFSEVLALINKEGSLSYPLLIKVLIEIEAVEDFQDLAQWTPLAISSLVIDWMTN